MTETRPEVAGAVAPPPLVFLGALAVGVIVNLLIPIPIWPSLWIQVLAVVPLVFGIWLLASANLAFRRHGTSPEPWKPSVELVQDGPYRFTRNPIYISFAAICVGVSFIFNSAFALFTLVTVLIVLDRTQIPREERYLKEKFREEYERYRARVPRWF